MQIQNPAASNFLNGAFLGVLFMTIIMRMMRNLIADDMRGHYLNLLSAISNFALAALSMGLIFVAINTYLAIFHGFVTVAFFTFGIVALITLLRDVHQAAGQNRGH